MSVATLEELGEAISLQLSKTQQQVLLALRGFANEAGVAAARQALNTAIDRIEGTQEALRVALDEERNAKEALGDAITEAEWEIRDRRIVKEGNKTFWVTDDDQLTTEDGPGGARQVPTGQKIRKQVTADEAREQLAREAARHSAVAEARILLRKAEEATGAARDHRDVAEKRFSAAKADLAAATAQLTALANTLPLVLAQENHR